MTGMFIGKKRQKYKIMASELRLGVILLLVGIKHLNHP